MAIESHDRRSPASSATGWTFLTNHLHVLLCIHNDPLIRQRDIASRVGITERAAQKIVSELEQEGHLKRERMGRRNSYVINGEAPLRHPLEADHTVKELLDLFGERA